MKLGTDLTSELLKLSCASDDRPSHMHQPITGTPTQVHVRTRRDPDDITVCTVKDINQVQRFAKDEEYMPYSFGSSHARRDLDANPRADSCAGSLR